MKREKRLLSLFLAMLIALSGLTVGFTVFADDKGAKDVSAVEAAQTAIQDWYDNHRNNLYATKAEQADAKEAARKAYDQTSKKVAALSDKEKMQMRTAYYCYWLTVVSTDTAWEVLNLTKNPTTVQKSEVIINNMADIEKVMGALPADYIKVIDAFKAAYATDLGGKVFFANTTKLDFKHNEVMAKTLTDFANAIKGFNDAQLAFSDYISTLSSGGFYFNSSNLNDKYAVTIKNLLKLFYLEAQDLNTASGGDPKFTASTYVKRGGSYGSYTYTWMKDTSSADCIKDFEAYQVAMQSDVIDQAEAALVKLCDLLEVNPAYKGIKDAVKSVLTTGRKVVKNEKVSVDEVRKCVDKVNALSESCRSMFDAIAASSDAKVAMEVQNVYTAADITPELVYTKTQKVVTFKLSELVNDCNNILYDLMLDEFNAYVEKTDLNALSSSVVTTAKQKYAALNDAYRAKITAETFAKFVKIVKPASDPNDFAKEVKAFNMTKIVRPENSNVAMTVEGIQSAVDKLWELVALTLVPLIADGVDLSEGLDDVLKDNVYTNEMISKIFDLYATLSRDETDIGFMGLTLGGIVNLLLTPNNIAKALEEKKFSQAAEIVKGYQNFAQTEETNKLEALAAYSFKSGDFGFADGDRAGFIDALLAVLRPITTLLAPGAKAMGVAALGINMFDYVAADGNYVNGVYSNLIPMLEQLGMTSLPSENEYEKNYNDKKAEFGANIAADEFLRPVIDSLFKDVVDFVSPDPLNGLIKILPRIAYIVGTDMLNTSVKAALAQMGMLSDLGKSLDISRKTIDNMLAAPIDLTGLVGKEFKLQLRPIDWMKLADCATVKSVKSHSNSNDYFILRTGDTDTCFTTVFYYIYDVAFADKDNYAQIKNLLNSMLGGSIASIVTDMTDGWVKAGKVTAYGQILDLLGTPGDTPIKPEGNKDPSDVDEPKTPEDEDNSDDNTSNSGNKIQDWLASLLGNKDKNNNNNSNNGSSQTVKKNAVKNPSIPNTGGESSAYVISAVYASLALAILCAYVVYKKKSSKVSE